MFRNPWDNNNNIDTATPKIDVLIDNGAGEHNIKLTIEFRAENVDRFDGFIIKARDTNGKLVGRLSAQVNRKDNFCSITGLASFRHYCNPNEAAYTYNGLGTVLVYLCNQIATKIYDCIGLRTHAYNAALVFYTKLGMKINAEYYDSGLTHRLSREEIERHYKLICAGDPDGCGFEAVKLKLYTNDELSNRGMKFVDNDALNTLLNSIQQDNQVKYKP